VAVARKGAELKNSHEVTIIWRQESPYFGSKRRAIQKVLARIDEVVKIWDYTGTKPKKIQGLSAIKAWLR